MIVRSMNNRFDQLCTAELTVHMILLIFFMTSHFQTTFEYARSVTNIFTWIVIVFCYIKIYEYDYNIDEIVEAIGLS